MKVDYAPYQLIPASGGAPRVGALIRLINLDGLKGYGDLHPLVDFGDEPAEKHLGLLKSKQITPLMKQTLWFAQRDLEARSQAKSLYNPTIQLRNNFLVPDLAHFATDKLEHLKSLGFNMIKAKVSQDLEKGLAILKKICLSRHFMVRLDFNCGAQWNDFENFMKLIPAADKGLIQYVEDPVPYDLEKWKEARKLAKIALDFAQKPMVWDPAKPPECDVVIVKPARVDIELASNCLKAWQKSFTVTNSLDHPIGSIHALSIAQDLRQSLPRMMFDPGCLTLSHYRMEPYGAELEVRGPFLHKLAGFGVGFDRLLQAEIWKPLLV